MFILSCFLAVLVGVTLGMIGSGGSILTLPIFVFILGVDPVLASAYSLFVVGVSALVGGVHSAILKRVDYRTALVFGIPSVASVFATRFYIVPHIPDHVFTVMNLEVTKGILVMIVFSLVMIAASISMLRSAGKEEKEEVTSARKFNYPMILLEGTAVGALTGFVGAGGGFLIIPALVILSKMSMKMAVGTSLFIIAAKSLIGFLGDIRAGEQIDWLLLLSFTGSAIVGIFLGIGLSGKIKPTLLKKGFAWFVLIMGVYILFAGVRGH